MSTFKVATYNVNSIRSRLHIIIPWLEKHRPNVLCMQETKVEDDKFPRDAFDNVGYQVIYKGGPRYNGVAIASLEKPRSVYYGLKDRQPADEDRLISAVYEDVTVLNLYVPQGRERESPQFSYKCEWFLRLKEFIMNKYKVHDNLLCCGDLNVAREEIDVHNPKRLLGHVDYTPEIWEKFDLLTSWGLIDIFRKYHAGEEGLFSFYDYRVPRAVERKLGWRVDHILVTPPLAAVSRNCYIDLEPRLADKPSDHTIMVAEFNL